MKKFHLRKIPANNSYLRLCKFLLKGEGMLKNGLFILVLSIVTVGSALHPVQAQNAALGERVPEIRSETWLGDIRPAAAPATVIAFFTASSPACLKSLEQLHRLVEKSDGRLRVILVTRDDETHAAAAITPYLSPRFTAAFDADGKLFKNFGVNYVPFSVLTDARNRVVWQGNSLHLTEKIVSTAR